MPRYSKFRGRRYRRRIDLPTCHPKACQGCILPQSPNLSTMPHRLNCVSILVILLVTVLGSIVTVKHLRYSWQTLPTYFGINETQNVKEYGQLGGGWICVYVPEGTSPTSHSLITVLGSLSTLSMSPIRMCSALVTWLEGGAYSQTNNRATIIQTGVVDTSRYSDTPAGTICASACPPVSQAQSWRCYLDDILGVYSDWYSVCCEC